MEKEQLVCKINLKDLFDPFVIRGIVSMGYRLTGNKFWISFNGSKGYFSHLQIDCEGFQVADNRIFKDKIFTKKNGIRKSKLNIFHSEIEGIRLSLGNDSPRIIKPSEPEPAQEAVTADSDLDDLPF